MNYKSNRIFYFDALRAFAILCVVLLHVTGHVGEIMNYNVHTIFSIGGIYETFANNFFRIGVDLFLMISGALLLGRNLNVEDFFKKRLLRIAKPFIFWSFIFSVILIVSSYFIPGINFVSNFSVMGLINVFLDTLMFNAPGSVVYWFFWMMLYVYLLMPVLNKLVNKLELVNVECILMLWLVFVSIVYLLNNPFLLLASDFISPLCLAVLGYYLRHCERQFLNSSSFAIFLVVVSSIFMLFYSYLVVDSKILFVFHRYSLLVVINAIGIFCLFKSSGIINNVSGKITKVVSSIALCSYGMYLIHSQIIMVTRKVFHLSTNFIFDYLLLFLVGFFLSWLIIYLLAKVPFVNDLIGVK